MRYGLILTILLLLGLAEYAAFEYAPLSSGQRKAKLERLPIVKQFLEREDLRRAQEHIEHRGYLEFTSSRDSIRWSSLDAFREDYRNGARLALPEVQKGARGGSPWDRLSYYFTARYSWDEADWEEA